MELEKGREGINSSRENVNRRERTRSAIASSFGDVGARLDLSESQQQRLDESLMGSDSDKSLVIIEDDSP